MSDNIKSPNHYTQGGIETIDYLRVKMTKEQFAGYCLGNVLKYCSRYRHKAGAEDLKKAQVYLGWLIEAAEMDSARDVQAVIDELKKERDDLSKMLYGITQAIRDFDAIPKDTSGALIEWIEATCPWMEVENETSNNLKGDTTI